MSFLFPFLRLLSFWRYEIKFAILFILCYYANISWQYFQNQNLIRIIFAINFVQSKWYHTKYWVWNEIMYCTSNWSSHLSDAYQNDYQQYITKQFILSNFLLIKKFSSYASICLKSRTKIIFNEELRLGFMIIKENKLEKCFHFYL